MSTLPISKTLISTAPASMLLAGMAAHAATANDKAIEQLLTHGQESYPAASSAAPFDVTVAVENLLVSHAVKPDPVQAPAVADTPNRAYALTPERAAERLLTGTNAVTRG